MRTNTTEAGKQASKSNQMARQGRIARDSHRVYEKTLNDWQALFANDPVAKYTLIFIIAFFVEVFVSYSMNLDIVRGWVIFEANSLMEKVAAVVISLLLNGLCMIASQLIGKWNTEAIVNFEVYNIVHGQYRTEQYPEEIAREKVAEDSRQDRNKFWLVVVSLVLLVGALTYQRIQLESLGNETQTANYAWAVIPFVVLMGEVWTGIYIYYVYRRFVLQTKNRRQKATAQKLAAETARLDRLVVGIIQFCDLKEVVRIADIVTCIYRAKHRSQDDDTYVDEVVKKHFSLRLNLVSPDGQRVSTLPVIGSLYEGALITGVQYTDETGALLLTWVDYEDQLDALIINGISFPGPFRANQLYTLQLGGLPPDNTRTLFLP